MKKIVFISLLTFCISLATNAQDNKAKIKPTSTLPQKVHNTFSKNKHHKGYKVKHKHGGRTTKHKVDLKHGESKTKVM